MSQRNATVAIYDSPAEARTAVQELQRSGFDMRKVSVAGRDCHEDRVAGYYHTGGHMKYWGPRGTFWEGLWTLLFGWAFFVIPGIGPVLVAGPVAGWIVAALENEPIFGGLSALGAALYSIGIARNSALNYEAALRADKLLVIAHGAAAEVDRARNILQAASTLAPAP